MFLLTISLDMNDPNHWDYTPLATHWILTKENSYTMSGNQNCKKHTQNIFCFDVFCDFGFFSGAQNFVFDVFIFCDFVISDSRHLWRRK